MPAFHLYQPFPDFLADFPIKPSTPFDLFRRLFLLVPDDSQKICILDGECFTRNLFNHSSQIGVAVVIRQSLDVTANVAPRPQAERIANLPIRRSHISWDEHERRHEHGLGGVVQQDDITQMPA